VYFLSNGLNALNADGTLRWVITDFSPYPRQSPAIGPDGTIYANTDYPYHLYAFNPNGTKKWQRKISTGPASGVTCSPAVGPDGTVYVYEPHFNGSTGSEGALLAYSPNGSMKWRAKYGNFSTSVSIGGDGTIYFGSSTAPEDGTGVVYALSPDGTLKWEFDDTEPFDQVRTPIAIGSGRVYAGDHNAFFAIGL
jgi:outer membrane protein assembly factor BamB